MLNSFVKTLIGGAIGIGALYVVGKIAYKAGYDMAETECRYNAMERKLTAAKVKKVEEETVPEEAVVEEEEEILVPEVKKPGILKTLLRLRKNKDSVIGNVLENNEIQLSIKPRMA